MYQSTILVSAPIVTVVHLRVGIRVTIVGVVTVLHVVVGRSSERCRRSSATPIRRRNSNSLHHNSATRPFRLYTVILNA
jgi:hypothetical protein